MFAYPEGSVPPMGHREPQSSKKVPSEGGGGYEVDRDSLSDFSDIPDIPAPNFSAQREPTPAPGVDQLASDSLNIPPSGVRYSVQQDDEENNHSEDEEKGNQGDEEEEYTPEGLESTAQIKQETSENDLSS